MAWVEIHHEAVHPEHKPGDWRLCLHFCTYHLDEGDEDGYRFIWRRPDGSLAAQRGQARIPSKVDADILWSIAEAKGWGELSADDATTTPSFESPIGHKIVTLNDTMIEVPIYRSDVEAGLA
jgi:hypothetical protein